MNMCNSFSALFIYKYTLHKHWYNGTQYDCKWKYCFKRRVITISVLFINMAHIDIHIGIVTRTCIDILEIDLGTACVNKRVWRETIIHMYLCTSWLQPLRLTFDLVNVCTAASTLAKFPFPSECPVNTYLPMHLTCFELEPPLLEWLEWVEAGLWLPVAPVGFSSGGCPGSSLVVELCSLELILFCTETVFFVLCYVNFRFIVEQRSYSPSLLPASWLVTKMTPWRSEN